MVGDNIGTSLAPSYIILKASETDFLEPMVISKKAEGYVCLGGIAVKADGGYSSYYQAMELKEAE